MSKLFDKKDLLIITILLIIFSIVDFWGLGNTYSPETFADFGKNVAEIQFNESISPDHIMMFTGVRTGEYHIEFSSDGLNYNEIATFDQNYGEVLRWENVPCFSPAKDIKYARIFAVGEGPYLGEVIFYNQNGNAVKYSSSVPEICDEQTKVVDEYSYLNSTYFDEIYHARTAWEHLNNLWPYEISHPPLGKIIISLGITLCGMTPFGWRFSGTLFGVLMIPLMYIFLKVLFKNRSIATCGALVFATDFMHYVQTRIATIDTYSVFFIILMYLFMYLYLRQDSSSKSGTKYLFLSGLFFGFGCACKWTSVYAGVGLAILWLIKNIKKPKELLKNILLGIAFFVIIPGVIYYLSYIPYGTSQGVSSIFSREYLKIVLDNQNYMFNYHSNLVAEHPYASKWYQWILNIKPILYYLHYFEDGTRSSFGAFLNPVLCLGGLASIIILIFEAITKKDSIAFFIVIGYLSQLVPWIFIERLTFEYHYFPCVIFLTLAVGYLFFKVLDDKKFMYTITGVSIALFVYFYPVLSGIPVDAATKMYHWMPSWPF